MNLIFDTHAHYDDDQFDGDRETLLASLPEQGVGLVVNPGCTVASSRTAVELAHRFPHVYAAAGRPAPCPERGPRSRRNPGGPGQWPAPAGAWRCPGHSP